MLRSLSFLVFVIFALLSLSMVCSENSTNSDPGQGIGVTKSVSSHPLLQDDNGGATGQGKSGKPEGISGDTIYNHPPSDSDTPLTPPPSKDSDANQQHNLDKLKVKFSNYGAGYSWSAPVATTYNGFAAVRVDLTVDLVVKRLGVVNPVSPRLIYSVITYNDAQTITNAGATFTVPKYGLELIFHIENWPFRSANNTLDFILLPEHRLHANDNTIKKGDQAAVGSKETKITVGIGELSFLTVAERTDSNGNVEIVDVHVFIDDNNAFNIPFIVWRVPAFVNCTLDYDPVMNSPSLALEAQASGAFVSASTSYLHLMIMMLIAASAMLLL